MARRRKPYQAIPRLCPADADLDGGALIDGLDAQPLSDMANAGLSAKCYLVGIDIFPGGCGGDDLYVLRYLCYEPGRGTNGWYYVNYWYCQCDDSDSGGELDPGGWTSMYSFSGSTCSASNFIDPVTVVFWNGNAATVEQHAAAHGDWTYHKGGSQLMFSYGFCYGIDGRANSEPDEGALQGEQFHMRLWEARDFNGDTSSCRWTKYVLATPHHEAWGAPQLGCGSGWHSVYDNRDHWPGGFSEARNDILDNWVPPHDLRDWQYWGNSAMFKQSMGYGEFSGGCWYAGSDGWVAVVTAYHV